VYKFGRVKVHEIRTGKMGYSYSYNQQDKPLTEIDAVDVSS